MNNIYKEFFRWLKEKGVYDKWVKNHTREINDLCPYKCDADRIPVFYKNERAPLSPGSLLSRFAYSFDWARSPEGYDFWQRYSIEWRRYCTHSLTLNNKTR